MEGAGIKSKLVTFRTQAGPVPAQGHSPQIRQHEVPKAEVASPELCLLIPAGPEWLQGVWLTLSPSLLSQARPPPPEGMQKICTGSAFVAPALIGSHTPETVFGMLGAPLCAGSPHYQAVLSLSRCAPTGAHAR